MSHLTTHTYLQQQRLTAESISVSHLMLESPTLIQLHWSNAWTMLKLILFLPGPLAPPRKMRPSRKMIALSYSLTIYGNKYFHFTMRVLEKHRTMKNKPPMRQRSKTKYLNAHPYGERQSNQREQNRKHHQDPSTHANVIICVLQGYKDKEMSYVWLTWVYFEIKNDPKYVD